MDNDIEFYLLIIVITTTNLLFFFIDLRLEILLLFSLINLVWLTILYLYFKRKKIRQKIINQVEEILNGNLNRRILIKDNN